MEAEGIPAIMEKTMEMSEPQTDTLLTEAELGGIVGAIEAKHDQWVTAQFDQTNVDRTGNIGAALSLDDLSGNPQAYQELRLAQTDLRQSLLKKGHHVPYTQLLALVATEILVPSNPDKAMHKQLSAAGLINAVDDLVDPTVNKADHFTNTWEGIRDVLHGSVPWSMVREDIMEDQITTLTADVSDWRIQALNSPSTS